MSNVKRKSDLESIDKLIKKINRKTKELNDLVTILEQLTGAI